MIALADFLAAAQPDLEPQSRLLTQLAAVLESDPACLGAAVVGSLAKGTADRLSDLDLVVFCTAGTSQVLLPRLRALAESTAVLYRLSGQHDEHSPCEKAILANLCSYELHLIEPPTRFTLKAPYIELVNRSKTLEARFSNKPAPERDQQKAYAHGDDGLAWELFNCFKWACRQQLPQAKQHVMRLGLALTTSGNA